MQILIHNIKFLSNRNYLFKSIIIVNFEIYAYMINLEIKTIIVCNNSKKFVKTLRNFRLKKIIERNYTKIYLINVKTTKLIIQLFKSIYKTL